MPSMPAPDARTTGAVVLATTGPGAEVRTDGSRAYDPLAAIGFRHARVIHSIVECVRGSMLTDGTENFGSTL